MAVGARLLAKQAIVSRLAAIEELAGVDVLCSDKTGTLTQNKLTLGDPFCVNGFAADDVILAAALASRAENKDTIDLAVLGGLKDPQALKGYQVLHFQPFDPVHKRTEATVKGTDGKTFKVTQGRAAGHPRHCGGCRRSDSRRREGRERIRRARLSLPGRGAHGRGRPLAASRRAASVRSAARGRQSHHRDRDAMGVKVKMVTGDPLAIAKETAKTLGMGTNILDGASLGELQNAMKPRR